MRGLVVLSMTLALCQNLIARDFPNGIPGFELPQMRSGTSQLRSNRDIFNSISRRIAMVRFSETLHDENSEVRTNAINHLQELVPGSDIATDIAAARGENATALFSEMQHFMTQEIRQNLIPSLRNIPDDCIISAGFTANTQNSLAQAGCYIRLGQALHAHNLKNLAVASFLKSGLLYATDAHTELENRTDLLLSAAQCYYWAYCNEEITLKKENLKTLYTRYFDCAYQNALLLNDTEAIAKIAREQAKIANARIKD